VLAVLGIEEVGAERGERAGEDESRAGRAAATGGPERLGAAPARDLGGLALGPQLRPSPGRTPEQAGAAADGARVAPGELGHAPDSAAGPARVACRELGDAALGLDGGTMGHGVGPPCGRGDEVGAPVGAAYRGSLGAYPLVVAI
jgi:hypothetical protein